MTTPGVQYKYSQVYKTRKAYFRGTTVLRANQALCYDEIGVTPVNALGSDVKVPTAGSLSYFAGLVDPADAGKTGPCGVTLIVPERGDYVDAEVDGTTDVAAGDVLVLQSTSTLEGFAKITPGSLTTGNVGYLCPLILLAGGAQTANSLAGVTGCFVIQGAG